MALTTTAAHSLALLLFNGTAFANWGGGLALTAGTMYVGLATSDPGVGASYAGEAAYTGYNAGARPGLLLTSAGWTVGTAGAVTNAAAVTFGACTASSSAVAYCFLCTSASGTTAANMVSTGTTNALAVSAGITPSFAIGALGWTIT
jgi:hypothetical protein